MTIVWLHGWPRLAVAAPNGRAVVFEGAGHFMSLDRPDEFDAVIADVLA